MLQSYSTVPAPQMCTISLSPLRRSPKRRFEHERHGSETIQRPRPLSTASQPTMQHSKRASIYVSDASILLTQRTPMVSPTSPHDSLLSPSNEEPSDHYAILDVNINASEEEIRTAYRRLRVVYFQSDAKKYRALQAAFDTLMDPEARQAYDSSYPVHAPAVTSTSELMEQPKHERKDSGHSSASRSAEMTIMEEEEEDIEAMRNEDPNWALKRHQQSYDSVLGTEPYPSFVPVLQVYQFRVQHPSLKCRRPTYIGNYARNAWPN
ncbi:hypothetical protein ACN47E_007749 [Coniothyrium glycines]